MLMICNVIFLRDFGCLGRKDMTMTMIMVVVMVVGEIRILLSEVSFYLHFGNLLDVFVFIELRILSIIMGNDIE